MASLTGLHGTHANKAKDILKDDFMINKKVGWLGTGVYFFEDNVNLASYWAKYKYKDMPCVIETHIEVFDHRILVLLIQKVRATPSFMTTVLK